MEGRIRPLPEDTARRIAAGEVISRSSAAVKELVENSIDAGATEITVEVTAGGKNLIRVVDNGAGMDRDNVRLSIARYATSKLSTIDDLKHVESYGFRGEALASIAAVSRMTVESNTDESIPGTRLEVEGGEVREVAETARTIGTTVTVRTLFFNLSPRRAFLKSDSYELRLVVETVKGYALAYPGIAFRMISEGRSVFRLPSVPDRKSRLRELFDRGVTEGLLDVRVDNPMVSVSGFTSDVSQARPFYAAQLVFFNRRPVRNRTVARAVYDAYGPILGSRRPNFILFIETDPARLDVNVHPTKQEVRFSDERFLFDFISEAVRRTLGSSHSLRMGGDEFGLQQDMGDTDTGAQGFWQMHNSYILAQVTTGYVVVDQHAAHERVLYEEALDRNGAVPPQGLLFPISVELGAEEVQAIESLAERLAQLGLMVKSFSGGTVVVEAIPAGSFMGKAEVREFLAELPGISTSKTNVQTELARLVACKGAVKAGQKLTVPEMESLFNRLFSCKDPYFCPHGRPAILKVTIEELERKFGRT